MPEHDPLINSFIHIKEFPREKEALHAIQKIASLVKPIMRARNWKVGTLAEFWPEDRTLLGINQNRGQKICLRLRYPGDKNQFLPLEQVVDTMLHELSHNVFGPHDDKFMALWDQLRKEYEGLLAKGYTGEGFLSEGHKLGGRHVPRDEARRIARAAAEKRRTLYVGSGQKLGGRPVAAGTDIRKVILDAIEQRSKTLKGCGSGNRRNDSEIDELADQATRNGFRTKADEDAANEQAIAQAMWELVQEDEKNEYGDSYIPPTPMNPTGNGGGDLGVQSPSRSRGEASSSSSSSKPTKSTKTKAPPIRQHSDRPVSRLVTENAKKSKSASSRRTHTSSSSAASSSKPSTLNPPPKPREIIEIPDDPPSPEPYSPPNPEPSTGWTCQICTLHNPLNYLMCDACESERPAEVTKSILEMERKSRISTTQRPELQKQTWVCGRCTTEMENKWWTCSTCGQLKASS